MKERLFQATRTGVCAGFIVRLALSGPMWTEAVHDCAPILRKWIHGERLDRALTQLRKLGYTVVEVSWLPAAVQLDPRQTVTGKVPVKYQAFVPGPTFGTKSGPVTQLVPV